MLTASFDFLNHGALVTVYLVLLRLRLFVALEAKNYVSGSFWQSALNTMQVFRP